MIYLCCLRFLREFEKWSVMGKIGKNQEKCLSQNPQILSTDDSFKFNENGRPFLQMGRKHCGKRRNCSLRAISPFPTVFTSDT